MPTTLESSRPASAIARSLCDKPEFQVYLGVDSAEAARKVVRERAGVETLAELDCERFAEIVGGFNKARGICRTT